MLAAQIVFVAATLLIWQVLSGHAPDVPSYFLGVFTMFGGDLIRRAWHAYGLDQE